MYTTQSGIVNFTDDFMSAKKKSDAHNDFCNLLLFFVNEFRSTKWREKKNYLNWWIAIQIGCETNVDAKRRRVISTFDFAGHVNILEFAPGTQVKAK